MHCIECIEKGHRDIVNDTQTVGSEALEETILTNKDWQHLQYHKHNKRQVVAGLL